MSAQTIYDFLTAHSIDYQYFEHAPVYTSEQARTLIPERPGASAKNLFLRDKKGRQHFLLVLNDFKSADFKTLAAQIGATKLSLASTKRLEQHLNIQPGAVSLLALINDPEHKVQVLFDESLWEAEALQCHTLINTATLVIPMTGIKKFFQATGHQIRLVRV